jgi:hypothetical protein
MLSNRLQFRESLDLPLARKVLDERKCPPRTRSWPSSMPGGSYRGRARTTPSGSDCATTPSYYLVQFPFPEKPLDDDAATKLSEDIDRLQNVVIPALQSKFIEVETLLRYSTSPG